MTIDMQQTAYQAFTGIRAIDHWLFHKHIEERFVIFLSSNRLEPKNPKTKKNTRKTMFVPANSSQQILEQIRCGS